MKCPSCGGKENKVVDSRETLNSIRRRRECIDCGKRFTSYETVEMVPILVIKKDGSREAFDVVKVKNGILRASEKRPVTMHQVAQILDTLEKEILARGGEELEVSSSEIGDIVMRELKKIDEISYIRFAAVYRQFKDISTFLGFIKSFEDEMKAKL
ncbi:MAG: transcriptional regulator NrdR [Christensenellaceae bacterium]|nr:transcriptional regulator NrdR [Christensenellaceae bacterium]